MSTNRLTFQQLADQLAPEANKTPFLFVRAIRDTDTDTLFAAAGIEQPYSYEKINTFINAQKSETFKDNKDFQVKFMLCFELMRRMNDLSDVQNRPSQQKVVAVLSKMIVDYANTCKPIKLTEDQRAVAAFKRYLNSGPNPEMANWGECLSKEEKIQREKGMRLLILETLPERTIADLEKYSLQSNPTSRYGRLYQLCNDAITKTEGIKPSSGPRIPGK